MDDDLPRQRQPSRHQERRPVDRVKAGDVLSDHMRVGGPEFRPRTVVGEACRGDVVGQRVDPDIHHMLRIAWHRHAPGEGGAADREVRKPALHEGDDLVEILFRRHEFGMGLVMGEEPVGVGRQPEEPALLLDPLHRRAGRAEFRPVRAIGELALVEIGLVAHRVPARIFRKIDVAVGGHALPDRLYRARVTRLRRAHDVVGPRIEEFAHRLEFRRDPVDEGQRRHAFARRGLLNLEAKFVHAGDEQRLAPVEPHEALDRVGRDPLVSVADMRRAVGVRDRCRDVETAHAAVLEHFPGDGNAARRRRSCIEVMLDNRRWRRSAGRRSKGVPERPIRRS